MKSKNYDKIEQVSVLKIKIWRSKISGENIYHIAINDLFQKRSGNLTRFAMFNKFSTNYVHGIFFVYPH